MLAKLEPLAFSALRIAAGFLFMAHGLQKLGLIGDRDMVDLASRLGAAAILEAVGGPLVMLGLLTVPTCIILALEMAVAYLTSHNPRGLLPIENGGELAVLYFFLFVLFATRGPGRWSLDRLRRGGG